MSEINDTSGRLVYIEPNDIASGRYENGKELDNVAWEQENLTMSVDLQVIIPSRTACGTVDYEETSYFINMGTQDSNEYISFLQGEYLAHGNGSGGTYSLTTDYVNATYQEVYANKSGSKEMLCMESIDITFDANMYPVITIKFVDIRGYSLMMPTEAQFIQDVADVKNGTSSKAFDNMFRSLFHYPYPRFLLTVKGFYGTDVTFTLAVKTFKSSLNPATGNFEVVVDFIGYRYGLYADIPLNLLIAAPYLYRDEDRTKGYFHADGKNNGNGHEIMTLIDFMGMWKEMCHITEKTSLTGQPDLQHDKKARSLEEVKGKIGKVKDYYDAFRDSFIQGFSGEGRSVVTSGETTVLASNNQTNELSEETLKAWKDFVTSYEQYNRANSDRQLKLNDTSFVGKLTANNYVPKTEISPITLSNNSTVEGFEYSSSINFQYFDKQVDQYTKSLDEEINRERNELSLEIMRAKAEIMGFEPTVENMFRMYFQHVQWFMSSFFSVLSEIKSDSMQQERVRAMGGLISQGNTDIQTKGISVPFVAPFPAVYKMNDDEGKKEEVYPGSIPGLEGLAEVQFTNQLIEGVVRAVGVVAKINNSEAAYESKAAQIDNAEKEAESGNETFVPIALTDYYYRNLNPYAAVDKQVFSKYNRGTHQYLSSVLMQYVHRLATAKVLNKGNVKDYYEQEAENFLKYAKSGQAAYTNTDVDQMIENLNQNFHNSFNSINGEYIELTINHNDIGQDSIEIEGGIIPVVSGATDHKTLEDVQFSIETSDILSVLNGYKEHGFINNIKTDYPDAYADYFKTNTDDEMSYEVKKEKQGYSVRTNNSVAVDLYAPKYQINVKDSALSEIGYQSMPYDMMNSYYFLVGQYKNFDEIQKTIDSIDISSTNATRALKRDILTVGAFLTETYTGHEKIDISKWAGTGEMAQSVMDYYDEWKYGEFQELYEELRNPGNYSVRNSKSKPIFGSAYFDNFVGINTPQNYDENQTNALKEQVRNEVVSDILSGLEGDMYFAGKKTFNFLNSTCFIMHIAYDNNAEKPIIVKDELTNFLTKLKTSEQAESTEGVQTAVPSDIQNSTNTMINDHIRLETYRSLKNLYDRWLCTYTIGNFNLLSPDEDRDRKIRRFHNGEILSTGTEPYNEFDNFVFVDSFFRDISRTFLIDPSITGKIISEHCNSGMNYSFLQFMAKVAEESKLLFKSFPVYNNVFNKSALIEALSPHPEIGMRKGHIGTTYMLVYTYEPSHSISDSGNEHEISDDALDLCDILNDNQTSIFSESRGDGDINYSVPAFGVTYARQNQMYFKNISVNMDSPRVTNESIKALFDIAKLAEQGAIGEASSIANNMYTVYSNRAYTCSVEMLGCMNIMPMMYFQLNNVPMFRGAYMISTVKHHIGPGVCTTSFSGQRISKSSLPIVGMNDLGSLGNIVYANSQAGGYEGESGTVTRIGPSVNDDYLIYNPQADANSKYLSRETITKVRYKGNTYNASGTRVGIVSPNGEGRCLGSVLYFYQASFTDAYKAVFGKSDPQATRLGGIWTNYPGDARTEDFMRVSEKYGMEKQIVDSDPDSFMSKLRSFPLQTGDLCLMYTKHRNDGKNSAHAAIYIDGSWYSDFPQGDTPLSNQHPIFRDSAVLYRFKDEVFERAHNIT